MTSLQAKAESVKIAVASTSTCTPATVTILSELLLPNTTGQVTRSNVVSKPTSNGSSATQPRLGRGTKPGVAKTTGPKDGKYSAAELSPEERAILSTEIINTTLKVLSNPLKSPHSIRRQPSATDFAGGTKRKALRRSTSLPQSPLQPRSLNRVSSSPHIGSRSSRSASSASATLSCFRATAECSRVAFACMRALQSLRVPCLVDLPPLQLENGMSALIGRLIGLGLEDLALKELRILKRRLDVPMKNSDRRTEGKANKPTPPVSSQTLVDLLDFDAPPEGGIALTLAIATQLQVLKLMATSKRPSMIVDVLPKLKQDNQGCPTTLLLRSGQGSSSQIPKIARQLETLSQLLLSFCPNISTSEDRTALSSKINVPPEAAFQLQNLAFHNRLHWWRLSNHQGDIENDVLSPFSRCLAAFARRSRNNGLETYNYASQAFQELQNVISNSRYEPSKGTKSSLSSTYKVLSSLAHDASRLDDATEWLKTLQKSYEGTLVSDVQRCVISASLAAVKLSKSVQDAELEELLMIVIEGLDGPLKGESSELDDLLSEVSKVRRAAVSQLYRRDSASKFKTVDETPLGVRQICESLILLCPRFSVRYLGKRPDPDSAANMIIRHEQRRQFVARSALKCIDSAFFLIKIFQSEGRLSWELMDSTMQDCLQLLRGIGDFHPESTDDPTIASASYFVRISHLYFTEYSSMRQDADDAKENKHLRPLRRSIDCVTSRPTLEKQAALLNSKLERLADAYKMGNRSHEAREALLALLNNISQCNTLSTVATAADTKPVGVAWDESDSAKMLARTVSSLVKLEFKSHSKLLCLPLYDLAWPAKEKGVLLELILDVLTKQTKESQNVQRELCLELLGIYEPQTFPVRRLRVIIRLLRLDQEQRRDLADEVKNALSITKLGPILERSEDVGLLSYLPHMQAFAWSILELQEEHPRVDLLKPHLISWRSTLDGCKDYQNLAKKFDDIPDLLRHLKSIVDFLNMKGFSNVRLAVLRIIASISEIPGPHAKPDDLILCYVDLGLQYLELGYSGKAGLSLDRAQSHALNNAATPEALLKMELSHAEYSLSIGNPDKCEEYLRRAQTLALQSPGLFATLNTPGILLRKSGLAGITAQALLIHSILALDRGAPDIALAHAKRCVKLVRSAWVKMAAGVNSKPASHGDSDIENLTQDVLSMSIASTISTTELRPHEQLPGPSAWVLVNPLFRSLLHLSRVYAHHGMLQETIYYAEQAHKFANLVESGPHTAKALTAVGSHWLSARKLDKASDLLMKAKELSLSSEESQTSIILSCHLGKLHRLLNDKESELSSYENASKILETLSDAKYISGIDNIYDKEAILQKELSHMSLKPCKPTGGRKTASRKKPLNKNAPTIPKSADEAQPSVSDECLQLVSLRGSLLRQKAVAFMIGKRCDEAAAALKEADACTHNQLDYISQQISTANQLLLQSVEQMSVDPVYSVLQDSTISFPAVLVPLRAAIVTLERVSGIRLSPPRRVQNNSSSRNRHRSKSPPRTGFFNKLRQAQEQLIKAQSAAVHVSSTSIIHGISSLQSAVAILLSAAGPPQGKNVTYQSLATCSMEISRNAILLRERRTIFGELASPTQKTSDIYWPTTGTTDSRSSSTDSAADAAQFLRDYVDIIPLQWTAISIALSESRQELCLTRMQAGQSPFTLRVPLGRNNSRDADEEVFDFDQGKAELLDIIEGANESSHGAKDLTGRGAKTAWWAERDALDVRLKELLENIETVWLGGFKGIFSQHKPRSDLLARFQKSFQNILDKHLPSRQKKGKSTRITLDSRVLELFIGLKFASSEDFDLDDALTDLLYFVVDILQFHGERNAYDEIDFDSVVIETHDALRSYHEAALAASTIDEERHTILILDKVMHVFPWESLPCMDGLAISRLPSLQCLRERILAQNERSPSLETADRFWVNRDKGSYVLNPGGDLTTTQSTFESALQALGTWNAIIKREPSEAEMRDCLESNEILLYFGHGSGAQYIRSKSIKRLQKCAVTMLMGCSSGALTEAGEFEPYGPPADYMLAGCPALVATLWDVTDKDIDRFAKSTFENWGLIKPPAKLKEQAVKGRGKKTLPELPINGMEASLVKAVSEGRKACNFRYLTAAAVCVYGIPVYIK